MNTWQQLEPREFEQVVIAESAPLISQGYMPAASGPEVKPTYSSVSLEGRNWVITFTCDNRDQVIDCDVRGRTESPAEDRALLAVLVDQFGFRGRIGRDNTGETGNPSPSVRAVRDYVAAIRTHAPLIWSDAK